MQHTTGETLNQTAGSNQEHPLFTARAKLIIFGSTALGAVAVSEGYIIGLAGVAVGFGYPLIRKLQEEHQHPERYRRQ